MSDNLTNIPLPTNTWVDLYALSGITVGQPLVVENVGVCDIYLAVQATEPDKDHDAYNILKRDDDIRLTNNLGDAGAWAFCNTSKGLVSVAEIGEEGFQPLLSSAAHDGLGNPLSSFYHAITDQYILNVHDADVHNQPINELFHFHTGIITTLASPVTSQDRIINVVSSAGMVVGDHLQIDDAIGQPIFPTILAINVNAITVDSPIDSDIVAGESVEVVVPDMGLVGTPAAPLLYVLRPPPNYVWHITRILISMTHGTAGDLGLFGNLAKLTNGVILRAKVSGQYGTFTNWKTNADIKNDMYDLEFDTRSSGGGTYGTSGRGSFSRIGVAVRLDGNQDDQLEVMVQDDLSGLLEFNINGQGHREGT